jgi:hypothetical protein
MDQKLKSEGKCLFCGETFAKAGIIRHLQKHLNRKVEENAPGQSYLVKVEPNPKWDVPSYFLSLWVDGSATMKSIDTFLRSIWLECCGHLSSFAHLKNRRVSSGMPDILAMRKMLENGRWKRFLDEPNDEIPMKQQTGRAFYVGLTLNYKYDFGSTTELQLTVVTEYPVEADRKIVLLSRNEPLELLCEVCKKEPATQICTIHNYYEESLFCEKCAKKHAKKCNDFDDYAALPVVNSPRMGVCAYKGGSIDTERDGFFVKK